MSQTYIFFGILCFGSTIYLMLVCFQVVPMKFDPRDEDSIKAVMAKANVVINLIGTYFCIYS